MSHMTVQELVDILDHYAPDSPVLIADNVNRICTDIIGLDPELPFPVLLIEHGIFDLDQETEPASKEQIH